MRTRLTMLGVLVALLPLALFGALAIGRAATTLGDLVGRNHEQVARRAAAEVALFIRDAVRLLAAEAALAASGPSFDLAERQDRLTALRLRLPYLRRLVLLPPGAAQPGLHTPALAPDGIPAMGIDLPVVRQRQVVAILSAELSLSEVWDEVERIRVGDTGFLLLFGPDGRLLGHGNPASRTLIFRPGKLVDRPFLSVGPGSEAARGRYVNEAGVEVEATAVALPPIPLRGVLDGEGVHLPADPDLGIRIVVEQAASELHALEGSLTRSLVVMAGLLLLAMLATAWILGTRWLTRPVARLVEATHRLARGDLGARVETRGSDELAHLGEAFNRMTADLGRLQDEVRRRERVATFGQIAAGLAHDLKHPVQNLQNAARLMASMADDPKALEEFRRIVNRELERLQKFLDDLRHLTAGDHLVPVPLDVPALAARVLEAKARRGEVAGVSLSMETVPPEPEGARPVRAMADRLALERVLDNLVANAIEATPPGGRVTLQVTRSSADVVVRVTDTGRGIPAERLPGLFEAFASTKRGGLGMGLAVCRRLTEGMGGNITVASTEGAGTTFTVTLPAAAVELAEARQ